VFDEPDEKKPPEFRMVRIFAPVFAMLAVMPALSPAELAISAKIIAEPTVIPRIVNTLRIFRSNSALAASLNISVISMFLNPVSRNLAFEGIAPSRSDRLES